jgi:hypothetical protein
MTNVEVLNARPEPQGGYRVDVCCAWSIGRVALQWFSLPADEHYLSLFKLRASVRAKPSAVALAPSRVRGRSPMSSPNHHPSRLIALSQTSLGDICIAIRYLADLQKRGHPWRLRRSMQ